MTRTIKKNPNNLDSKERTGSNERNETYVGETSPTEMRKSFSQSFFAKTKPTSQDTKQKEMSGNYDIDFPSLSSLKQ